MAINGGIKALVQMCQSLGPKLITHPFIYFPKCKSILEREMNRIEDFGPILAHSKYKIGVNRSKQSYVIPTEDWLHGLQNITTIDLFSSDYVAITAFCLPPNATLPLHDHPGMHVICRPLPLRMGPQQGASRLQVRSFDWNIPAEDRTMYGRDLQDYLIAKEAEERVYQMVIGGGVVLHEKDLCGDLCGAAGVDSEEGRRLAISDDSSMNVKDTSKIHAELVHVRSLDNVRDNILTSKRHHNLMVSDQTKDAHNARMVAHGYVVMPDTVITNDNKTNGANRNTPPSSSAISPSSLWIRPYNGGVLHQFSAPHDSPVVFVDILSPPYYRNPLNISCTYFEEMTRASSVGDTCVLRTLQRSGEAPESLTMDGYTAEYLIP